MKLRRRLVLAAAMILGLSAPAGAQPRPGLEDPQGALVAELVVVAAKPGPAWWRVEDDDSTVYILALPDGQLPPGVTWDRATLQSRMTGANLLFMGTQVNFTAKLWDVPALLKARKKVRTKTPLEETLPPALAARFAAARQGLGKPAERYEDWQPMLAGMMLLRDAFDGKGWTSPDDAVKAAAKKARVPVKSPPKRPLVPFMKTAIGGLTPQIQTGCLTSALDDVEAGLEPRRRAARAWARGDVPAAVKAPRSFEACLLAISGGAGVWRDLVRDDAAAIAGALETPGHSVVVINLRTLLARDGVVRALEAQGLEVIGPGAEE